MKLNKIFTFTSIRTNAFTESLSDSSEKFLCFLQNIRGSLDRRVNQKIFFSSLNKNELVRTYPMPLGTPHCTVVEDIDVFQFHSSHFFYD